MQLGASKLTRPLGTAAELEQRRRRVVEALNRGERPTVVARLLGVNRQSLYRWRRMAEHGREVLKAKRRGPNPQLSDEQLHELEQMLLQGAQALG